MYTHTYGITTTHAYIQKDHKFWDKSQKKFVGENFYIILNPAKTISQVINNTYIHLVLYRKFVRLLISFPALIPR